MNSPNSSGKSVRRFSPGCVWLLAGVCVVGFCACALGLPTLQSFLVSFPEILLGQVTLSQASKPLSPRAYKSAEFVLNQVAVSEVEQAFLVVLYDDVLFWDPWYTGFARAELTGEEVTALQQWLSQGTLFYPLPSGAGIQCVANHPGQPPALETCPPGIDYLDQYTFIKWDAAQNRTVAVLVLFLSGGRLVEIRIYPSQAGLAYEPFEKSGDWWLQGVAPTTPFIEKLTARAAIPPVEILWPELTADQANARAARVIGSRYQPALEFLRSSTALRNTFGEIQEIRPATGTNTFASWMDSTSVFLTFRVSGSRGEGAAIVQGYNCFDLKMVFQGRPVDDGSEYICP